MRSFFRHISCYQIRNLLWVIGGVLLSVTALGQQDYELFGSRDGETVKLYWDCRSWPADQQGFLIRKRESGVNPWVDLHSIPLIPAVDPATDFSSRGLSSEASVNLQQRMLQLMQEGKLSVISPEEMRGVLVQNNGPGSGDRIRMKSDYELALILGFAFIDQTTFEEGKTYEYALHAVYLDGSVSSQPLDIFSLGLTPLPEPEVDFLQASGGIQILWTLPEQAVRDHAIMGYRIARKDQGPAAWVVLTDQPIGFSSQKNGEAVFRFQDNTARHDQDYWFELTPVDMFQQTGKPIQVFFSADRHRSINSPQIKMVSLEDEVDMAIYWAIDEKDSLLIRHFILETSLDPGQWEPPLAVDTIDPSNRWFLDQRAKGYGQVYFYRLRAIGKYDQEAVSGTETFYYMGLMRPPAVQGLQQSILRRGEETYVHLRWTKKPAGDTITRGYAIYSDELIPDSLLQLSNLPLITATEYLYPITTQGGRVYRFRVAALSEQGKAGEPAETTVQIGTLKMPRVYQTQTERVMDDNLLIKWEYPLISDLQGFRIMLNGQPVAQPGQVTADMRSYLIPLPKKLPAEGLTIAITAVGSMSESESGMPRKVYLPNYKTASFPPPATIWHEPLPEGIQLCWTPPSASGETPKGYALFADYATPGVLQRLNGIPLITATDYLFTTEIPDRESITLGVAAVHPDGSLGRIREIKISKP